MVAIQQDACIFFGSTTLPTYLLKIYALPAFIAPVTNLRNTTLIQNALQDMLNIPIEMGVIIYIPVSEDNFATNGSTARGDISRLERHNQDDTPGIFRTISRSMSRRLKRSSGTSAPISVSPTITGSPYQPTDICRSPITEVNVDFLEDGERGRSLRKRKSLRSIFRRGLMELTAGKEKEKEEEVQDHATKEP